MKANKKRKGQNVLVVDGGVVPVTIEFKDDTEQTASGRHSEHIQFVHCAVGTDPRFKGIPEEEKSSLVDTGGEDDEEKDDSPEESEEDDDD
jgi:hypothetical protein